jgi:hypothetical protein
MTELEQLRKEVNDLRERVAVLETRLTFPVRDGHPLPHPVQHVPFMPPQPPWTVTCGEGV